MAEIFRALNDKTEQVQPKNGNDFSLEELQAIVKGYVQTVYLSNDKVMVMNEEGKLLGLDYNMKATMLLRLNGYYDYVVGDVLICESSEIK